jgi:hypothetical protein
MMEEEKEHWIYKYGWYICIALFLISILFFYLGAQ